MTGAGIDLTRGRETVGDGMSIRAQWSLYVAAGVAVAVMCLVDFSRGPFLPGSGPATWMFVGFAAVAVACSRLLPEVALAAGWGAGLTQLLGSIPLSLAELPLVVVLFGCARWGRIGTVLAAGATIPLAPFLVFQASATSLSYSRLGKRLLESGLTSLTLFGLAILGLPWLLGLTLRFLARASQAREAQHTAEQQVVQAQEIVRLREEQNRLARDVHDVVGHSLAVILAQAESAQFLDDADTTELKRTMATIATSARTSLQDVRYVLSPDAATRTTGRLETLIDGIRGSGRVVDVQRVGAPRPMPPELEQVAYRVLQEMLTNAIKHGDRERPIAIELAWPDDSALGDSLRIEVGNAVGGEAGEQDGAPDGAGQGVDGMRRRLASVGGHFDVRRCDIAEGRTFTATAWVPVRDTGATGADGG